MNISVFSKQNKLHLFIFYSAVVVKNVKIEVCVVGVVSVAVTVDIVDSGVVVKNVKIEVCVEAVASSCVTVVVVAVVVVSVGARVVAV